MRYIIFDFSPVGNLAVETKCSICCRFLAVKKAKAKLYVKDVENFQPEFFNMFCKKHKQIQPKNWWWE